MYCKVKYIVYFLMSFIFILACKEDRKTGLKSFSSFPLGTAVSFKRIQNDTLYEKILLKHFNSITAEGKMKMHYVLQDSSKYTWEKIDSLVGYAERNHLRVHGHTLIWHRTTPDWVKNIRDSARLEELMKKYIHDYVTRYKGRVESWDVVNEAISDSAGLLRESVWLNILGPGYIERAFKYAHEADPEALLFYNDYSLEIDAEKRQRAIELIDHLRNQSAKVDGLGFQMHIMLDTPHVDTFQRALSLAAERGLLVHASELDVRINRYNEPVVNHQLTDSLKKLQAVRYKELAEVYCDVVPPDQRFGITLWGFADHYSWIPSFYETTDWPCIYDSTWNKKPAFQGFQQGLQYCQ